MLVDGLSARLGGGETLLIAQMEALCRVPGLDLAIYATPSVAERLGDTCGQAKVRAKRMRSLTHRLLWEQLALPRLARRYDVLYMPGNFAVFMTSRPQVVAFQNAIHFGSAGRHFVRGVRSLRYRARVATERRLARASLRRATAAVLVSESLDQAVEEDFGRLPNVHLVSGAPTLPRELGAEPSAGDGVPAPGAGTPYALAVAHDYFHKDWDGLIATFLRHRDLPELVLVGQCRSERRLEDLRAMILAGHGSDRIHLIGPVLDDATIHHLYSGAACYVAHSHLEAFPLTPRDAVRHGLPLVASDIPAHRELDHQDTRFYSPSDLDGLAEMIRRVTAERSGGDPPLEPTRTWADNAEELAGVLRGAVEAERV